MTFNLNNLFYSHRSSLTGFLMTRVRVRRWAVTVRKRVNFDNNNDDDNDNDDNDDDDFKNDNNS